MKKEKLHDSLVSLEYIIDLILNDSFVFENENGDWDKSYIIERFNLNDFQYKYIIDKVNKVERI